jgi:hypothetical protein
MDLPSLRHFANGLIISDPVEALIGEAWVNAVLCQRDDGTQFWASPDLSKLGEPSQWRHAVEERKVASDDLGQHQSRDESGQTAKASNRNRARKSRQVTQAKE